MITSKDLWDDYKRNSSEKRCFYHDKTSCSKKIKKAHSIQKEKILSQLEANVNGNNVIYGFDSLVDNNFKPYDLAPIGKKKASIFTGFCDYHDSKLFSPLENFPFTFSDEQLFLLTYRAFAHGYHQLLETLTYYRGKGIVPTIVPKHIIEEHIHYVRVRIHKFDRHKRTLDKVIVNKNFNAIKYHTRVIEPFIPLACSSVLSPVFSVKNVYLNPSQEHSHVVLNVLPDTTRTIIILAQFEEDQKGSILFEELRVLPDNEFTDAISSLMIYCTGNTFLSPTLWAKFTPEKRKRLFEEYHFCTDRGTKIKEFFKSEINFFRM